MTREHEPMNRSDDRFDQTMRALHAQAVAQVSSPTRARLRVARQAAARPAVEREPRRGLNWVLGSGLAAVFAVAIGLQLRPSQAPAPAPSAAAVASATSESNTAFDTDTAIAALDENPDLYLWLASNDDAVPTLEP
ncbi:hypothetical protein [Lysobacter sp. FW306-1B-D06B]|uniref:hypothetical protein n=1 Tax=Lysobacter sp. FW306-1B-D06B TaxID=3140250 RepID=UPI0031400FC8